jgi:Protein of unknown function (DUF2971)
MRVYHFLSTKWALDDIAKRRLKISEIDKLNDPFELWCVSQEEPELRAVLSNFKTEMGKRCGMLCFSKHWNNPLLWSHYADKHRGMCLGFEIDENTLKPVTYVSDRPELLMPPTEESINQLLFTKFEDWQYEEELRNWFHLNEREGDHFFYPFDEHIQLREVIAGPLCPLTKIQIDNALRGITNVAVIKGRLAFKSFRVVRRGWGFDTENR